MSCCSKEKMDKIDANNKCRSQNDTSNLSKCQNDTNNLGKSHATAKLEREMYRICPSKLSKRELEDLYFTLLENNVDLKKTINGLQDKIKVLSTQVHRMSSIQGKIMSKEQKECCLGTKAIVNEQKDYISDLKDKNQQLSERIDQLNMRLCSAKQFLKSSIPRDSSGKPLRHPPKHDCLNPAARTSSSCQWEDGFVHIIQNSVLHPRQNQAINYALVTNRNNNTPPTINSRTPRNDTPTQVDVPRVDKRPLSSEPICNENKCRTVMEDLKTQVATLQAELLNVHNEYSDRISRLENEVAQVRKENVRVNGQRTASEHELNNYSKRTSDAMANYRNAEAKCAQLAAQLSIEKRKVAELETQLKASTSSHKVHKAIEAHLSTIKETNDAPDVSLSKSPRGQHEQAPPNTLPPISYPKKRDLEDPTGKTNASKRSPTRSTSSLMSPQKKVSSTSNCETCGCQFQLTSDPVVQPPSSRGQDDNDDACNCRSATVTCSPPKGGASDECSCISLNVTSTPIKDYSDCSCPTWIRNNLTRPTLSTSPATNSKCLSCCFGDEYAGAGSPATKNANSRSPKKASEKNGSKPYNISDDSGYLDNSELAEKRVESIENQKSMKNAKPIKPVPSPAQAPKKKDTAEKRVKPIQNQNSMKGAKGKAMKPVQLATQAPGKADNNAKSDSPMRASEQDDTGSCKTCNVSDGEPAEKRVEPIENQKSMKGAKGEPIKTVPLTTQAPEKTETNTKSDSPMRASEQEGPGSCKTCDVSDGEPAEKRVEQIENPNSMNNAKGKAMKPVLFTTQGPEKTDNNANSDSPMRASEQDDPGSSKTCNVSDGELAEKRVEQIENPNSMNNAKGKAMKPVLFTTQAPEKTDNNANSDSPMRASEQDDPESCKTCNVSDGELSVLQQKKDMLENILKLQRQIYSAKIGTERPVEQIENELKLMNTHDRASSTALTTLSPNEKMDYTEKRIQEIENLMSARYKEDTDKPEMMTTNAIEDTEYNQTANSSSKACPCAAPEHLHNSDLKELKLKKKLLAKILALQRQIHDTDIGDEIIENQIPMEEANDKDNTPVPLTTQVPEKSNDKELKKKKKLLAQILELQRQIDSTKIGDDIPVEQSEQQISMEDSNDKAMKPVGTRAEQIENQMPMKNANDIAKKPVLMTTQAPGTPDNAGRPVPQNDNESSIKCGSCAVNKPALLTTPAPKSDDAETSVKQYEKQKSMKDTYDTAIKPVLMTTQMPGKPDNVETRAEQIGNQMPMKDTIEEINQSAPLTTQAPGTPDYNAYSSLPGASEQDGSKPCSTCGDSGYQDNNELSVLQQKKDMLEKILELQRQIYGTKIVTESMAATDEPKKPKPKVKAVTQAPEEIDYAEKRIQEIEKLMSMRFEDDNEPAMMTNDATEDTQYNYHHSPMRAYTSHSPRENSVFQDDNELSVLKQKRDILAQILGIQRQIQSTKLKNSKMSTSQDEIPVEQIENQKSIEYANDQANKPGTHNSCCGQQAFEKQELMPREILNTQVSGGPQKVGTSMAAARPATDDTRAESVTLSDGTQKIIDQNEYSFRDLVTNARTHCIANPPNKLKNIEKAKPKLEKNKSKENLKIGPGFNPEKLKYLEAEGVIQGSVVNLPTLKDKFETITEHVPSKTENVPNKLRALEALAPSDLTAANQTPNTKNEKVICKDCAGCTFDKECEINYKNGSNPYANNDLPIGIQKEQATKSDQHNSLQLPGPTPTLDNNKREKANRNKSVKRREYPSKDSSAGITTVLPKNATDGTIILPDVPLLHNREVSTISYHIPKDIPTTSRVRNRSLTPDMSINDDLEPSLLGVIIHHDSTISHPLVPVQTTQSHNRAQTTQSSSKVPPKTDQKLQEPVMTTVFNREQTTPADRTQLSSGMTLNTDKQLQAPDLTSPSNREQITQVSRTQSNINVEQNTDQVVQVPVATAPFNREQMTQVGHKQPISNACCRKQLQETASKAQDTESIGKCDSAASRQRSVTYCERPVFSQEDPPAPAEQQDGRSTNKRRDKDIQAQGCEEFKRPKNVRHAQSPPQRCSIDIRLTTTSPDNTDLEVSYLSDLPMEKERSNSLKSRSLSPGEDRTTTYSTSCSPPTTYTLSEGEMPATTSKRRAVPEPAKDGQTTTAPQSEAPAEQQMEEALQAIADELERCKALLQSYRPGEVTKYGLEGRHRNDNFYNAFSI